MHATEAVASKELSERLRELGFECALLIGRDPASYGGEGAWLRTLPFCHAEIEHDTALGADELHRPVLMTVGLDDKPIGPEDSGRRFLILDDERETNRIQGPVVRRLGTGWTAATHRFVQRQHDRYFDFRLADARRIALLAALTFNPDFDGSVLGLDLPWERPRDSAATFDGRGWAWAIITAEHGAEPRLLEVIGVALSYLRRRAASADARGHAPRRGPADVDQVVDLAVGIEHPSAVVSPDGVKVTTRSDSPAGDERVPDDATTDGGGAVRRLSPAHEQALLSFEEGCRRWPHLMELGRHGRRVPTEQLHERLSDEGCDAYPAKLPAVDTWKRYVREGLRQTEGPVNSPRAGRPHGSSIVRARDVDPTHGPD